MDNKNQYILQSVDNTLILIELLAKEEKLGIAEISRKLNIGKSTVFRMLATLENKKFVNKTFDGKYELGIKFAHYGSIVVERQDFTKIARPYLSQLRDQFNETTHLAVLDDDFYILFVVKEKSNTSIQMSSNIGVKLPAYNTAVGKAILTFLPDDVIEDYLSNVEFVKKTYSTISDSISLKKELQKIRRLGFSEDLEESEMGLTCFAAPVRNIKGEVIAAVSISGPSVRMEKNRASLIKAVQTTADRISNAFGWCGD